jgi:lysozyme family protein
MNEASPSFERALKFILDVEGGFSNHPHDTGGKTFRGILQREYDVYRDNRQKDRRSVKLLEEEEMRDIYYNDYWVPGSCFKMPWPLDTIHFDGCVNTGVGQAGKFLQRAVGATADGAVGPKTLAALKAKIEDVGLEAICKDIIEQRDGFYKLLAFQDSKQKSFSNGWSNRLEKLKSYTA